MTREEAETFLCSISGDLGFTDIENYTCKDGEKMREAIKALEQDPCEDAISRQAVLELVADYDLSMGQVVKGIHALPSVTAQPNTGRWEWVQYDGNPNIGNWHCSECRSIFIEGTIKREKDSIPFYKYCPQCGAKMKEDD